VGWLLRVISVRGEGAALDLSQNKKAGSNGSYPSAQLLTSHFLLLTPEMELRNFVLVSFHDMTFKTEISSK
jgi:hypothetical protein